MRRRRRSLLVWLESLTDVIWRTQNTGACIGLEVNVCNEGDEGIPDNMTITMADTPIDGLRRRVTYKVSLNYLNPFPSAELMKFRYLVLPKG